MKFMVEIRNSNGTIGEGWIETIHDSLDSAIKRVNSVKGPFLHYVITYLPYKSKRAQLTLVTYIGYFCIHDHNMNDLIDYEIERICSEN